MSIEEMEKDIKDMIRSLRNRTLDSKPKRFAIPFSSVLEKNHSTNQIYKAEEYSQDKYNKFKNILKSEFLSH